MYRFFHPDSLPFPLKLQSETPAVRLRYISRTADGFIPL